MAISISPGGGPAVIPGAPTTAYPGGYTLQPPGTALGPTSISQNQSAGQNTSTSTSRSQSGTYIPDYAESPILREIAQYSRNMAPQVYQWGMDQYNKNQGNIDSMMRNALAYASPQRIAQEMGKTEAGVMQGAEQGRQNALRDLQSYGIDPSSGRYAALDQASQVMAGAQAAGAGNQQRTATEVAGAGMAKDAMNLSNQNYQTGYGAADAANKLLSTGMQLKFPPLGQTSTSSTDSSSQGTTDSSGYSLGFQGGGGGAASQPSGIWGNIGAGGSVGIHNVFGTTKLAAGGSVPDDNATAGGFVSNELSPSNGAKVDDVQARLNAGEFVIPKDVSAWLGQEYFYKLMAKARAARATAGSDSSGMGYQEEQSPAMGYGAA